MTLSKHTLGAIKKVASRYPRRQSAMLPAMHLAQADCGGFVSMEDQAAIANELGMSLANLYGAQSYYTMLNQKPVGKYHLQVDTNIPAMLMGADKILGHMEKKLQIKAGETTDDGMYTLSAVEDLGSSGTCPVVQVNDQYYDNMTTDKVDTLIDDLASGVMPSWPSLANYHSECNILLKRRGIQGARDIDVYMADGGYAALKAARSMDPSEVCSLVKSSVVRGRGGAGFPAGVKWGFLPKESKKPVYLICNADEGEPGTFKDRQIMEYDPHLLLEGIAITAHAIGAKRAYIYIRGEFKWMTNVLETAIVQARQRGALGADAELDIVVHRGGGAYVCGEETALIESLEGKRGNPRLKPPFPAVEGLYGCPTIVNNVETLANIPYILNYGPEAYKKIGTPNNHGPKIYCISGHVNRPGVYEYPMGTPLETLLEKAGGVTGKLKGVIVGGLSTPILTKAEAEGLIMDYDSCLKAGTMLGSGAIIVVNEETDMPRLALRTIEFYAHESCGQCTPCREGSAVIAGLLGRILNGTGEMADINSVLNLCSTIKGSTLCPAGDAFATPVAAMVSKYRHEFEALIK